MGLYPFQLLSSWLPAMFSAKAPVVDTLPAYVGSTALN